MRKAKQVPVWGAFPPYFPFTSPHCILLQLLHFWWELMQTELLVQPPTCLFLCLIFLKTFRNFIIVPHFGKFRDKVSRCWWILVTLCGWVPNGLFQWESEMLGMSLDCLQWFLSASLSSSSPNQNYVCFFSFCYNTWPKVRPESAATVKGHCLEIQCPVWQRCSEKQQRQTLGKQCSVKSVTAAALFRRPLPSRAGFWKMDSATFHLL